jgi:hypothetical protein
MGHVADCARMVVVKGWVRRAKPAGSQFQRGLAHIFVSLDDNEIALARAAGQLAADGWEWEGVVEVLQLHRPQRWPDSDTQRSWELAEKLGAWPNYHLYPREADNREPLS